MSARLAILISGGGSNMEALIRSCQKLDTVEPVLVLSDQPDAGGLVKADNMYILTQTIDKKQYLSKTDFEMAIDEALKKHRVSHICLAGFMRVLSPDFCDNWQGQMLNIHPSLLPKYKGLNTHQRALDAGDQHHGCSVHEVTSELDGGRILGQARLSILPSDTADTLAARVLKLEHKLYSLVLQSWIASDTLIPIRLDVREN